jgi:hypothetical protein
LICCKKIWFDLWYLWFNATFKNISVYCGSQFYCNLAFPAVTICNVNAVRKGQLHAVSQQLQSLVAQTDPKNVQPPVSNIT